MKTSALNHPLSPQTNKQNRGHYSVPSKHDTSVERTSAKTVLGQSQRMNGMKKSQTMSSADFAILCEQPKMKRNQSYDKMLQTEKIKLQLQKFEKNSIKMKINERLLFRDKHDMPKVQNLRQLKRKCVLIKYKETMQKIQKLQNQQQ